MARKGYTTIALPDEMVKEIDEVVKQKKRGYTSRAELIKEAVRVLIDKIRKQLALEKLLQILYSKYLLLAGKN